MSFVKKMLVSLSAVALLCCLCGMSSFAMGTDVKMTFANVNMRTGPSTDYSVIMVVPSGATVYIEENRGDWSYVDYNAGGGSVSGWVSSQYLGNYGSQPTYSSSNGGGSTVSSGYHSVSGAVNLRSGPSTDYPVYTVVPAGASVYVANSANGWSNVAYGGYNGYISTRYISGASGSSSGSSNGGSYNSNKGNIAYAGDQVLTSSDFTNMYNNAGADSEVLAQLCSGTRLYVLGRSAGWYQVSNCGVNGWIPAAALCKYLGGPCLTT